MPSGGRAFHSNTGANSSARSRAATTAEPKASTSSGCPRSAADKRHLSQARSDAHRSRLELHFWQCRHRRRRAPNQWCGGARLSERLLHGLASRPLRQLAPLRATRSQPDAKRASDRSSQNSARTRHDASREGRWRHAKADTFTGHAAAHARIRLRHAWRARFDCRRHRPRHDCAARSGQRPGVQMVSLPRHCGENHRGTESQRGRFRAH